MADPTTLRSLAFLLPQFHPIPENDEWWGKGFTEWTNVVRARTVVRGHHQPHLPADLGFYDLRLPEARAAQADLAGRFGVDGFVYYHFWFEGRRLLERPFEDVLRSGEPDFPFCLCWANENWTRGWGGGTTQVLMPQAYSADDDLRHIRWLAEAFADRRYIRVDGRPLLLVYRVSQLPDAAGTAERWRREAVRLGVGDPYLCSVQHFAADRVDPTSIGFDAAVQFAPDWKDWTRPPDPLLRRATRRLFRPSSPYRKNLLYDYDEVMARTVAVAEPGYKRFRCVAPGFDSTPRRPNGGATILTGSSPAAYERWLRETVRRFEPYSPEENLLFVNAWNEWGEGNHLEPDQRWGTGFLESHARVMRPAADRG